MALLAIGLGACNTGAPGSFGPPTDHRAASVACPANNFPAKVACKTTADCNPMPGSGSAFCNGESCQYDRCLTDADCGASGVCSCKGMTRGIDNLSFGNVCVPGNCRIDSNCGSGGYCSPSMSSGCSETYGVAGYYCHNEGDECANNSDCNSNGMTGACAYAPQDGIWECNYSACDI